MDSSNNNQLSDDEVMDITSKWILSCGRFGVQGKELPDIFASFQGIEIEVKMGLINNDRIILNGITVEQIKQQFVTHIKEKLSCAPTMIEFLPQLVSKLNFPNDLDEEFISNVAFQNSNGTIPTFYLCDHKH